VGIHLQKHYNFLSLVLKTYLLAGAGQKLDNAQQEHDPNNQNFQCNHSG